MKPLLRTGWLFGCLSVGGGVAAAPADAPTQGALSVGGAVSGSQAGVSAEGEQRAQPKAAARPAPGAAQAPPAAAPPNPSREQVGAFEELRAEYKHYERTAEEYQKILTSIVKHHFEERRRRVVSGLSEQIDEEQVKVGEARQEAIRRLEEFIRVYSGDNAHPESTPDAMYRLAALYEERARADFDADLTEGLKPAIALYRRIIEGFPDYREIAGVHYYLGHAYLDSGELDQAQQAWRALVCANHYSVRTDVVTPEQILIQPLPQDHDERYWQEWYARNPIPFDQMTRGERARSTVIGTKEQELEYINPYAGCEPLAQETKPGEEPRYIAEVWWQLGNYHFDQLGKGGPYAFNRAATTYELAMEYKKPPLYGVAMYKRAWTYFKQQRYRTAVNWFVNLLFYADEQEEKTGDPGADFRAEAYTYIAGSLTYVDFSGPPPGDPYIPRNDVLDLETDPLVAEEKMAIAIERVQDPELIPQDEKWTVEIYKAVADEFREIAQHRNAIRTLELTLQRFPLDRDAPRMQNEVAELYDEIARAAPEGSAVREEASNAALSARTALSEYVGDTAWTRANQDDPEAIQQAELLVRRGLQRAAADHTNYARAYVSRARQVNDEAQQRLLIEKAIDEYRLAARGWAAYIEQDPNAVDAYESRFWLADARFWSVVLQVQLGQSPSPAEVEAAEIAAKRVRDSNEDDQYLQPAAYYLVVIADKVLEDRYREYQATGGASGLPELTSVTFEGEGDERRPVKLEIPAEVLAAVEARDEYNARIAYESDPQRNGLLYAFQAADYFFVYGDFDEAERRFVPIMEAHCGSNEWGYQAWEKLISMSNFRGDTERSRELVEGRSCAFDEETRAAEEAIRTPVKQGVAYLDARKLYEEAEQMPDGPERDRKWRQAAAAYKVALDAAPDRDEAPEAAMNGAYAYKQVGDYDKAIAMYELFISRYGNEKRLAQLRQGDPTASPPVEPDPSKFEERVKFLKMAYDALANAYVLFFDYPKAASTFDDISENANFTQEDRRVAAQQAMNLYASLGDTKGMQSARNRFARLGASREELAEADFVVASSALKQWDASSPDSGANAQARQRAELAMRNYYETNRNRSEARRYVVEAAYWVAKMKAAARSGQEREWWDNTIRAFEAYKADAPKNAEGTSSALGSRQATMAAEGAYTLLDREIRKEFDYDTGHHHFAGTPQDVLTQYQSAARQAKTWFDRLQKIIDDYASPEWGTAAVARQGSLYDSLRTGLYNTRPPELKMFDDRTERMLRTAEESDNLELQEKADAVRVKVETAWQENRDRELEGADQVMVDRYSRAITMARRYNVSNPAVVRAIQRLAFFTDVIGEAKLKAYTEQVPDMDYEEGLFLRIRPGLVSAPPPKAMPELAPSQAGAP